MFTVTLTEDVAARLHERARGISALVNILCKGYLDMAEEILAFTKNNILPLQCLHGLTWHPNLYYSFLDSFIRRFIEGLR